MADIDALLEKTSRTFALSIPRLPEPIREQVSLAYLLFRIADTFEDAAEWSRERQIGALEDFCGLLEDPDDERAERLAGRWARETPIEHDGYLELLAETPAVLTRFGELEEAGRAVIREHTLRTARGMAEIVSRTGDDGVLRLRDLEDLRGYCYVVAGIVGEMLTELFLLGDPGLEGTGPCLRERADRFGEGLQLVNILKDAAVDAREGRLFLPRTVERPEVFALARSDLEAATEYILALQEAGAARGVVAFNALPVRLAWATLEVVEEEGPGAKIERARVWSIVAGLEGDLDAGRPAARVPRARQQT